MLRRQRPLATHSAISGAMREGCSTMSHPSIRLACGLPAEAIGAPDVR